MERRWRSRSQRNGGTFAYPNRKIKTDITRIYEKEIENKRYPSPLKLKNIYLGIETKTNTVLSIFKKMNEEKRKEVGTSLSSNTYKNMI